MQLITENGVLERNLIRCARQYDKFSFATAWASADTSVFRVLYLHKGKIRKAVIGTHFCQTHPDVLDKFVDEQRVRFILQPTGVFHPKIYVFWNRDAWEALVGSANLTKGALGENSEAVLLVSDRDEGSSSLREEITTLISGYWNDAECASQATAARYRAIWNLRKPVLDRLSGQYGHQVATKSPFSSIVMSMSWENFYEEAQSTEHFPERCDLLNLARQNFETGLPFNKMDTGPRLMIAGLRTDYDQRWGWFGSMIGNGKYYAAVNRNDIHLSRALGKIPLQGVISRAQYDDYIAEFIRAFPEGRHGIATASRLLALKRPDQFVCFDKMNRKRLCEEFGIRVTSMDYDRYWNEIIERVMDSVWWNSPEPNQGMELSAWKGRVALLDAIFYKHE